MVKELNVPKTLNIIEVHYNFSSFGFLLSMIYCDINHIKKAFDAYKIIEVGDLVMFTARRYVMKEEREESVKNLLVTTTCPNHHTPCISAFVFS